MRIEGPSYAFVPVGELDQQVTLPDDVDPGRLERVTRRLPPEMRPSEWVRVKHEWLVDPPRRRRRR